MTTKTRGSKQEGRREAIFFCGARKKKLNKKMRFLKKNWPKKSILPKNPRDGKKNA